ncbi:MAG: hypothetical protein B7Y99_09575 [Caulobacterales bacterium 32-69-10]|nr:MAG: hypothetical protein B7Y99_09575 [Caulobacterales bacterium 32-69-10]
MIRYALLCDQDHAFEAWFDSSDSYDSQTERGLVECPFCASHAVRKQIMAPAVAGTKRTAAAIPDAARTMMLEQIEKARRHVEQNFDYVGDRFAQEARDIHEGDSEARHIYGEATAPQVRALVEDGIPVAALPPAITPRRKDREN